MSTPEEKLDELVYALVGGDPYDGRLALVEHLEGLVQQAERIAVALEAIAKKS